ncbi:MAG TPA: hypothetical protein VLM85_28285 [Polyangiaceae bacterium]|nr:hypothetical protein [Polyangiaceae bacterium]
MRKLELFGFAAVSAFFCALPLAQAQSDADKNIARAFGQEGQAALDKGDGKTAEDRFHRAVTIFDNAKAPVPPTLLLGYARGAAKNNHFIAAEEAYNRIIRSGLPPGAPAPFVKALEDAKQEIGAVAARIANVTINVSGCDNPSVTLDGAPVPSVVLGVKRPIDPGSHELKAEAAGCKPNGTTFTVADGKETTASVALERAAQASATTPTPTPTPTPPPATAPPPTPTQAPTPAEADTGSSGGGMRVAGWVGIGVGGAGLILGAVTGGVALGKHGDLANVCTNGTCPPSAQDTLDSYHLMGTLSTVGFIVGGAGLAAGVTLLLLAPSSHKATTTIGSLSFTPYVGFGSVGAVGTF